MRKRMVLPLIASAGAVLWPGAALAAEADPALIVDADGDGGLGTAVHAPTLSGSASGSLTASVSRRGSGTVTIGRSPTTTTDRALRFPAYTGTAARNAVIAIRNTGGADALAVGAGDFSWQADFIQDLDLGDVPAEGDNIVQRGLWGGAQWKLSADRRRVACHQRVDGAGAAIATPKVTLGRGWFRATCARTNTATADRATLTLTVQRWNGTAWVPLGQPQVSPSNAYGPLTFPAGVPVSIGGKVGSSPPHPVPAQPDQFNGSIDNVVVRIGP